MPDRLVPLRAFLRRGSLRWLLIEFMLRGALQFARQNRCGDTVLLYKLDDLSSAFTPLLVPHIRNDKGHLFGVSGQWD